MEHLQSHLRKFRERLKNQELDAFVVSMPENRYYLSGFSARDLVLNEISGFLVIGRDKQILITDGRYVFQARQQCPLFHVVVYREYAVKTMAQVIRDMGAKRVGVEAQHLIVHFYQGLVSALQGIEVVPTETMMEPIRAVKEDGEIEKIRNSAALTERALQQTLPRLKAGLSEKQVAWWIESAIRDQGAEAVSFDPIVASGPNGAKAHHEPSERPIREGEPIIIDIGSRLNGYCSDMTRTIILGNPSDQFKEIYSVVRRAQLKAISAIKPGMMTSEADAIAREVIEKAGYGDKFLHSLGHGVGLATHESPRLSRINPTELLENMVVTVEPGIYVEEWGGVRLEEMIVIRENGAELLTTDTHFYHFD